MIYTSSFLFEIPCWKDIIMLDLQTSISGEYEGLEHKFFDMKSDHLLCTEVMITTTTCLSMK